MTGDGEINKTLAKWLTKAKTMPAPPSPSERRASTAQSKSARAHEPTRQLNLKIPESSYLRIKGLAHRDRHSLVAMLDEMVGLYEKAHGKLDEG